MSFLAMVTKNVLRQRVRAVLTLVGITLGITTVVALGVITAGLKDTAGAFIRSGGASFLVAQEGAADLTFSTVPESALAEIGAVPGVSEVRGAFLHIARVGSNPFFFVIGVEPDALTAHPPDLVRVASSAPTRTRSSSGHPEPRTWALASATRSS